jgi:hypothetical protein
MAAVSAVAEDQAGPARSPAAAQDDFVSRKLKGALLDASTKLGPAGRAQELTPWQKSLLEDEALPQYQRFVRNFKSAQSHNGSAAGDLEIDIDQDALRTYLKFYAPVTLGREGKSAQAVVFLRPAPDCAKCELAAPQVRTLVQTRLERRGLQPAWLAAEDLGAGGAELVGKALEDKVAQVAAARGAGFWLSMQWGKAPADDVDAMHADEVHYLLRSRIEARGLASSPSKAAAQYAGKSEGLTDFMDSDSIEQLAARLLSDAFAELGAQAAQLELALSQGGKGAGSDDDAELRIEIGGIRDFGQYSRLKAQLSALYPAGSLEERLVARGRAMLALVGDPSPADKVKADLTGLRLGGAAGSGEDGGRLVLSPDGAQLGGGDSSVIALEIKP